MKGVRTITLNSDATIDRRYESYAVEIFEEIQKILRDKSKGKVLIQLVIAGEGEKQVFHRLIRLYKDSRDREPESKRTGNRNRRMENNRRNNRKAEREQREQRYIYKAIKKANDI